MDREIISKIQETARERTPVVLATVIRSSGSAPRSAGARMLIWQDGTINGTIGGGPLEGEIIAKAVELLENKNDKPDRYHFDLSNQDVASAGGVCGGQVEVFLEPLLFREES